MRFRLTRLFTIIIASLIFLLFTFLNWGASLYIDWLWFKSLNYQEIFITFLLSQLGIGVAVGILSFGFLFISILTAGRYMLKEYLPLILTKKNTEDDTINNFPWVQYVNKKAVTVISFLISLFFAYALGSAMSGDWIILQKFLNPTVFGVKDPIFLKDIGFYVFQLPFYQFIYKLLIWLVLLAGLLTLSIYLLPGFIIGDPARVFVSTYVRRHLSILAAVFLVVHACGYQLQQYVLMYSQSSVVYGPGYADVHATILAYKILFFLALLTGVAILFLRRFRLVVYSIVFLIVASICLGSLYPDLVQKFIVTPNEMEREKQYIEYNIKYTQMAYGLDKIENKYFPAGHVLSAEDIRNNQDTIQNIRLWDHRPLKMTYGQLQEMRTYYEFKDIDVDRYLIDDSYRQVMLSARELNTDMLPEQAKTWVNLHLKFTHGYGVAMSPVNEVSEEGLPLYLIKDIPPTSLSDDLIIERPEIYFGETTNNYVALRARTQEFDYPVGKENAWTTYKADQGVKVESIFRKAIFALAFKDYKFLLSGDITNESLVLYNRNIWDRVSKIAPFLVYDEDPYIVVADGKLYWMWDAYTTSKMYPYAEPAKGGVNYIRNAVKVVVDAYTGSVTFYAADPQEPILKTYQKIFSSMFVPLSEMPAGLQKHIRYPEHLFTIQADKYALYHMENYRVFYNKEDKWNRATELYGREEQQMGSYYTILKLEGEERPEFVQIMPFTPQDKKNMIGWLVGRSDSENYGKLLLYEFPKQELTFGPMQIETRISQNAYISQQISLWDQAGSQVLRGNMMVIPVKDALLYVKPLFLQSEQSKMPELRRVIVAHGEQIVMEPTLEACIQKIFDMRSEDSALPDTQVSKKEESDITPTQLLKEAIKLYEEAQRDWSAHGNSLEKLRDTLEKLENTL